MLNKKLLLAGVILSSALLLAGCDLLKTYSGKSQTPAETTGTTSPATTEEAQDSVTITFDGSAFLPNLAEVKSGGSITWKNDSSEKIQVGSANHPTHTVNQEITGNKFVIELAPGQSETVTITKVGTWGYHNHLNASTFGKVTVK